MTKDALLKAYNDGLGDGLVYATAVMSGNRSIRERFLERIFDRKKALGEEFGRAALEAVEEGNHG